MKENSHVRTVALVAGLVQGLLLLLVELLAEWNLWPVSTIGGRFAWYSIALAVPTLVVLVWEGGSVRRLGLAGAGLALVLLLIGAWSGEQTGLRGASGTVVAVPYFLTVGLGWFVLLPFVQVWQARGRFVFPYPLLFQHSWNNALTLAISAAFTGLFKALLSLWAGLFQIVGIEFFQQLFSSRYFNFPVLTTVFAFALYLSHRHVQAVTVARRIVLTVFRNLLPVLALMALLFLAVLPFTGLAPLWRTGYATPLLLALVVLMIVFVNAVYQDGRGKAPYAAGWRHMVEAAVFLLPAYVALAGYSLGLRVVQHGWSVERFWGVLLVVLAGLYAVGYASAVWSRRKDWLGRLGPINVALAALLLALAVLVNSPLLDARRIAASSQVARLLDGRQTAERFDYRYLRFKLGRPGEAALSTLASLQGHPQAALIRERASAALEQGDPWMELPNVLTSDADVPRHLRVFPRAHAVDPAYLNMLYRSRDDHWLRPCFARGRHCLLLSIDLNRDRKNEYVLLQAQPGSHEGVLLYARGTKGWERVGVLQIDSPSKGSAAEQEKLLESGQFKAVLPPFQDLMVGDHAYRLR